MTGTRVYDHEPILTFEQGGNLCEKPVITFRFDEIQEAHRVIEANQAGGKMVVVLD
jgi:hypothetical protein